MLRYLSSPFKWFFKLEAASGLVLLLSAIIALVISNSYLSELYFETLESYVFLGLNNFILRCGATTNGIWPYVRDPNWLDSYKLRIKIVVPARANPATNTWWFSRILGTDLNNCFSKSNIISFIKDVDKAIRCKSCCNLEGFSKN